ncbi:MAG TPA: LapA family protein [Rhodocyclaceae bacterium]|nr:LapA family protein [Rhodocyclaceae bacterium]
MKILGWIVRVAVFIVLFGLAIKNSTLVDIKFYFDRAWQMPLSLVILIAFGAGAAFGLTAVLATLVRQRRELGKLRRLHEAGKTL